MFGSHETPRVRFGRREANGRYVDNNKKAKTMNLRGTFALWLGKLRIYLSVSICH